jgi:hypothetical protein
MKNGMLRLVAHVRTDVSEELSASTISVTSRLLVTANVPSSPILVTLMMEALSSFETSVLTRATRRNIPEDAVVPECRVFCKLTSPVDEFRPWLAFMSQQRFEEQRRPGGGGAV